MGLVAEKIKYVLGKRCPQFLFFINYKVCDWCFGKVSVMGLEETLAKICNGRVSMSRFGDGEFDVMSGRGNGFQKRNAELGKKLKYVIKQNGVNSDFVVCIPRCFESFKGFTKAARNFLEDYYLKNRFHCVRFLNCKSPYYDSFVTRLYMDIADKSNCGRYFSMMKSIWENQDILIIEGDSSRLGMNNDLFDNAKSVRRVLAPRENAYDCYQELIEAGLKYGGKEKLILLALGQTATALAYDLYQRGCWAMDIGHIDIEYEWYLQKAEKKIAIKGKYVNEVNHRNVEEIDDERYEQQIVLRLGVNE